MMSLATIRAMSRERAYQAAKAGLTPMVLWDLDDIRRMPNIGSHVPRGWTLLRVFFVDASGWGRVGEPAYTLPELRCKVVLGRAYAIVEEGQFQVHVGEFCREGEDPGEVDMSGHATFPPDYFLKEASDTRDEAEDRREHEARDEGRIR